MSDPVILLEFNELSPSLMAEFMSQGHLPGFKKLYDQSSVYVTDAEESPPNLEPWIQWITVHTGLTYQQHGIFDLGDGHKLDAPRIWDLLRRSGKSSWVCGSMNASFERPFEALFLPDPWSMGVRPFPEEEFAPYYNFVSRNVQEYTRDHVPLTKSDQLRFITYMVKHGLSMATAKKIATQLLSEKGNSALRWQRAMILDRLQWDIFISYHKRYNPDFSTFFLNSTAHFQHMYWRNMAPDLFDVKPGSEEQSVYKDAILTGYKNMDAIVSDCLRTFGSRCTIILATALSQQPCLKYESQGGKKFYRITDESRLYRLLSIPGKPEFAPVMSEQFHIYFANPEEAERARVALSEVTLDGSPAFSTRVQDNELFGGCCLFRDVPRTALLTFKGASVKFYDLFYQVDGTKSGMHHPDGILWIRALGKAPYIAQEKVPLRNLAPTILSMFGIPKTSGMTGEALPEFAPAYSA